MSSEPIRVRQRWNSLQAYIVTAPLVVIGALWLIDQAPALRNLELLQRLEHLSVDLRFRGRAPFDPPASPGLFLAGIDESSIERFGRWPWDRAIHGDLCTLLAAAEVKVLAFDLFFPEPGPSAEDDAYFGEAAATLTSFVSGASAESGLPDGFTNPPGVTQPIKRVFGDPSHVLTTRGALTPIEPLASRTHFGFVNAPPTTLDGVRRTLPLVIRVGDALYPNLTLQTLMRYWNVPESQVEVRLGDKIILHLGQRNIEIPITQRGELWLNYRNINSFKIIGYDDLTSALGAHFVHNEPMASEIADVRGSIVVVGQVADGLTDLGPNPLQKIAPLVLTHLNGINSILMSDYLSVIDFWQWAVLVWLGVAWLSLFLLRRRATRATILWPLFVVVAYVALAYALFAFQSISLPIALPVLGYIATNAGAIVFRWIEEQRNRRRVSEQLRKEAAARDLLEKELQIAHEIQASMLPREFFPERTEFDLYARMQPAKSVGGDLYDFFFVGEESLFFVIGDVAGKGVPAALFMTMALSNFRANATSGADPAAILARSNNTLAMQNRSCTFVTTFCGILNTRTGHVCYANGGHNPPVFFDGQGNVRFLEQEGIALGPMEDMPYCARELQLAPGEGLVLYTDGVTEAFNTQDDMYEESRLADAAKRFSPGADSETFTKNLWDDLAKFTNGAPQADDITILTLRYTPGRRTPSPDITEG